MNNLFRGLKFLKQITPDEEFAARSRMAVLGAQKRSHYRSFFSQQLRQVLTLGLAMSMALVLILVLGRISNLPLNGFSSDIVSSLNAHDLAREERNINFQIYLAEARYYKESTQQVTMAIGAVFSQDVLLDAESIRKQAASLDLLIKELTL